MRPGVATLLLTLVPFLARAEDALPRKVLIIGIDGLRPDALQKARTSNLAELARDGAFSYLAQTGKQTISGPGWSSLLTGVRIDKHGVTDNSFKNANFRQYPHFFRHLKDHDPKRFTASIVHWAPIHEKIVSNADISLARKTDAEVRDEAIALLRDKDPDVLFLHFDDVDGAGHSFGFSPTEPRYLSAIETVDGQVGAVLKALRGRPRFNKEDWLILVSTDHGGLGKKHGGDTPEERTIFLLAYGPSVQKGEIQPAPESCDLAVTALTHLGVPLDPAWKLDGKAVGLKNR